MEKVMEDEKIKALVEGKTVIKVIAVPKKLVNIVVSKRSHNLLLLFL